MNGLDSSGGPCLLTFITSGIAHFNYDFVCGDHTLSGFMNGVIPMKIISILPNPARDLVEIILESEIVQQANIEIINSLGEKIFSGVQRLNPRQNTIRFDMRNFSGGIFIARIQSERGSLSQKFLKVK
ncbi:MAG: T9SS type A sorting domain-containing protein [Candidatus Kapaibacterium sp.]